MGRGMGRAAFPVGGQSTASCGAPSSQPSESRPQPATVSLADAHFNTGRPDVPESTLGLCVVCMDSPLTHAMVPCGHLCVCELCSAKLMEAERKACPMCNQVFDTALRVFTAACV